jgi:hypothetical protein
MSTFSMSFARVRLLSGAALMALCALGSGLASGCGTMTKAAKEDPMKCERDPKCEKKRGRTADCSRQCSDDPACVDRCEQVQRQNGGLGH